MKPLKQLALVLSLAAASVAASAHEVGSWAGASNAPAERSEVAVAALDGKAYVIGDYNGATDLLVYDIASDHWSIGTPFPYAVHHTAAASVGGLIYVFGGYVNGWTATEQVWAYNPADRTWNRRAPIPTARAAAGAAVVDGKIHLVSGSVSGRGNTPVHEVYDPATDRWSMARQSGWRARQSG